MENGRKGGWYAWQEDFVCRETLLVVLPLCERSVVQSALPSYPPTIISLEAKLCVVFTTSIPMFRGPRWRLHLLVVVISWMVVAGMGVLERGELEACPTPLVSLPSYRMLFSSFGHSPLPFCLPQVHSSNPTPASTMKVSVISSY